MEKVAVIGAGNVGATSAHLIAQKSLATVVMVDIVEGLAKGKALDISQAMVAQDISTAVEGTSDFEKITGSSLVIITAGLPRRPGMSRSDLLEKNAHVIRQVVEKIRDYALDSRILMVTNPLDEMTCLALRQSGFDRKRVFGMGGALDSARFTYLIAKELGVQPKEISAVVIGSHSDRMLPLPRLSTVADTPLTELLNGAKINDIVEKTRQGGAEIVSYLKSGSAFYAPATVVLRMAQAILLDTREVLSCSVSLNGEYGLRDTCLSVPVRLGKDGVEEIIEVDLSSEELEALSQSAQEIRASVESAPD
jgi:malate dehydrogenase